MLSPFKSKAIASDVYDKTDIDIGLNLNQIRIIHSYNLILMASSGFYKLFFDRTVPVNNVNIDGQFSIHATSDNVVHIQK